MVGRGFVAADARIHGALQALGSAGRPRTKAGRPAVTCARWRSPARVILGSGPLLPITNLFMKSLVYTCYMHADFAEVYTYLTLIFFFLLDLLEM